MTIGEIVLMKPHESPRINKNQFVAIRAIRGLCGIGVIGVYGSPYQSAVMDLLHPCIHLYIDQLS